MALGGHARAVELHQFDGDVSNSLARLALGRGPVAAAHFAQPRSLATDIPAQQVELVGGNVELVPGVSALIGRVLDDEELPLRLDRVSSTRRHLALHEFDEPADSVRVVHHEIAGLELQRINDVFAAARELLDLAGVVAGRATVELALAEQRELDLGELETLVDGCLHQVGDTGLGLRGERVYCPPGELMLGEHIGCALDESRPLGDDSNSPAVPQEFADVAEGPVWLAREVRHRACLDAHVRLECRRLEFFWNA